MSVIFEAKATQLRFRFPFKIAHGERTHTDCVVLKASVGKYSAQGEATLPPYLPDTVESVLSFLSHPFFKTIEDDFQPAKVFVEMEKLFVGNMPAKAAVDMALWQLKAEMMGKPLGNLMGLDFQKETPHSYTIGICSKEEMEERLRFGMESGFSFFKLKLDGQDDRTTVENYLSLCEHPFAVDANQSWDMKDEQKALSMLELLKENHCVLIEQPFIKTDRERTLWLRGKTDIPIIADEACQRLSDLIGLHDAFDGINIKLQKCGGLTEAKQMIDRADELDMKVLIGCMSESAIGCGAAEVLAPLCDWADLDGPFLIID